MNSLTLRKNSLMQNDVLLVTMMCFVLLLLLFMAVMLTRVMNLQSSQSRRSEQVLLTLLNEERLESQSLRNQLRSPDLVTLHGLNSATRASVFSEPDPEPLTEDQIYLEQLKNSGQRTMTHDLAAAGWVQEEVEFPEEFFGDDLGGSPIVIDEK